MSTLSKSGPPVALSIAGSDPTGGAGVQADLQVFWRLGLQGLSVITAVTAQNSVGVRSYDPVSPELVAQQLGCLVADYEIAAVKTGMLARAAVVEAVADTLSRHRWPLVVDPVVRSHDGHRFLGDKGVELLVQQIIPRATVVTPNLGEAGLLAGMKVQTPEDMKSAAEIIHRLGPKYVLVKGGHLDGPAIDVLFDGRRFELFEGPRLPGDPHGTGCLLSAALTGYLAHGLAIADSVRKAKRLVAEAIGRSVTPGHWRPSPAGISLPGEI